MGYYNPGPGAIRQMNARLEAVSDGNVYMVVPKTNTNREMAKARKGATRVRRLVKRYLRKEFTRRELDRRTAQLWASI